jgi:hypothetical protein
MALGALELGAGHPEAAQTWLAPAVADIRAMGIARWLGPAELLLARAQQPGEGR